MLKKVKVKVVLKLDVKTDPDDKEMMDRDVLEAAKEELEAMEDEPESLEYETEEDEEEDEE